MRTKLEENAGSGDFWKCVRAIGLTKEGKPRSTWRRYMTNRVRSKLGMMLWRYGGLTSNPCWVVKVS